MTTPLDKSLRPVPRTLSEATRDAQYACAIQTFKSDAKLTLDFIKGALIGAGICLPFALICYYIVTML